MELVPEPATEWRMMRATSEGRVFHRWEPLPRVRSPVSIDSRPNEQFAEASVSEVTEHRNSIAATVMVPAGDRSALLTISRPFFRGYRATIAGRSVPVGSYRGLLPVVELPPGASGRFEIVYRPWWLSWGGGLALFCLALLIGGSVLAVRGRTSV
jgi:hypothetical protein